MTPFYYIDGTWKGRTELSDFRPTRLPTGETYFKYTFAMKCNFGILYTDIASINLELKELKIEEKIPFYIRSKQETTLKPVPSNGRIE